MRVLLSRVDANSTAAEIVKGWIQKVYGPYMMQVQIPRSTVNTVGAVQFGTVYDIARYEGSNRTYSKIRDAYDEMVRSIDQLIISSVWNRS